MPRFWRSAALSLLFALSVVDAAAQIRILTATGATRDGLPVVRPHPDPAAVEAVLTRGFSGRLLRWYAREQEYLRRTTGRPPEPAYLVLSDRRGGFAEVGFDLDGERKPDAGWVDLHRDARLSGRFGTVDQMFPHELLHVIARQLAGEPRQSGGNQVHAAVLRTDPVTAFNEGLAEHAQIMAVDDPDAMADTAALPGRLDLLAAAEREVAGYARDLTRRWWPVQPSRLRFLLWFSSAEQVQRYHAVKANRFARLPVMPREIRSDGFDEYLLQSVVPGSPGGEPKPASVMLATDGGVAHLFWRLVTDAALQQRYRDDAFYADFGTSRDAVEPLENVYLKMFAVLSEARPATAADAIRGWARVHPADAGDVARVAQAALLDRPVPDAPEIWLANDALMTGTSLFDQYRALPRPHTFDANAALRLDWLTVPGVGSALADRLMADAPYRNLEALLASPALSQTQRARIAAMSAAMSRIERSGPDEETLSLSTIAGAYLWRLGTIVLIATVPGAWFARFAGVRRFRTAALVALTATTLVIALAWVVTSPAWYSVAAPVVLGGVPWAVWRLARGRTVASAARALAAWMAAATPSLLLTLPR